MQNFSTNLLDGKACAKAIRQKLTAKVAAIIDARRRAPCLCVIRVGDDPASERYVRSKQRACKKTGIFSRQEILTEKNNEATLLKLVDDLNADPQVDGILVQLPLPGHIHEQIIIERIAPSKDVDGLHPMNVGRLAAGLPAFAPCTPAGVMQLLQHNQIDIAGMRAVVLGRSNIVGKPMAHLLTAAHATVTLCHSRTPDLPARVAEADLLVSAMGRPEMVKGKWITQGAVVVDVGINHNAQGQLVGDVEFEVAKGRAAWISPVPGGVGPMTVAMLLKNTLQAYEQQESSRG